jgi:hypothetical protein
MRIEAWRLTEVPTIRTSKRHVALKRCSQRTEDHMKGANMGIVGVGILLIIIGAINHLAIKANPVSHFSTILGVLGVIIAIVGVVMSMGAGKAK